MPAWKSVYLGLTFPAATNKKYLPNIYYVLG